VKGSLAILQWGFLHDLAAGPCRSMFKGEREFHSINKDVQRCFNALMGALGEVLRKTFACGSLVCDLEMSQRRDQQHGVAQTGRTRGDGLVLVILLDHLHDLCDELNVVPQLQAARPCEPRLGLLIVPIAISLVFSQSADVSVQETGGALRQRRAVTLRDSSPGPNVRAIALIPRCRNKIIPSLAPVRAFDPA
jgi:hypothetical protein